MLGSGKPQRSSSSLASDQIGRAEPSSEPAYNHLAQKTFEACDIAVLHQIMQHQRDDHADTQQFHERNETHADHGDLLYSKSKSPASRCGTSISMWNIVKNLRCGAG